MARKKAATTPVPPAVPSPESTSSPTLTGRTFFFGTFPTDLSVEATRDAISKVGASMAETLSATTSFLVLDRINPNKKSRLEKEAEKLNGRGASIQILDRSGFLNLVGIPLPAPPATSELPDAGTRRSPDAVRKQLLLLLQGGPTGVQKWNDLSPEMRREAGHFRKVDLAKAKMREANLAALDFSGANFDDASLIDARLDYADFTSVSFLKANLRGADLRESKFANARFVGANLKDASLRVGNFRCASFRDADLDSADLSYADLCGADFSGATLDKTVFDKATYDGTTRWPDNFTPGAEMTRIATPADMPSPVATAPIAGMVDIATFVGRVEAEMSKSSDAKRVFERVKAMLKAEKFRLFAEVTNEHVGGVVKSQNDTDPQAVYSCRLTSAGFYDCYSPKLPTCGGMRYGGPCKHLLVLLIGLVRAGQLDATTADWWLSQTKKRSFSQKRTSAQEEPLYETLLKYKGVEAGEVDWRPTETVPEDYYAL